MHEVVAVEQVLAPGEEVAVYDRIAEPFVAGADHDTVILPVPACAAVPLTGAPGSVAGVNAFDAAEAEPVPVPFVAVTVNVYDVPFVSPVTVHHVFDVTHVTPPGDDVTVYDVGD